MSVQELIIDHIGTQGDGVAKTDNGPVYVPFTLEGERVSADVIKSHGTLIDVLDPSEERINPICDHFGQCGGCTVQHMASDAYIEWKMGLVTDALSKSGIDQQVERLSPCLPNERRRVVFTALMTNQGLQFGYYKAGTHDVIDIDACPIVAPLIAKNISNLKDLAQSLASHNKPLQLTILSAENGLDIALSANLQPSDTHIQSAIRKIADNPDFIRLSFGDDVLLETQAPIMVFGDTSIYPPAGNFAQASARAEQQMVDLVCKHLKSCKKIADLFSGCGTFSFPLAHKSAVHAVETNGAALNAIDKAFRGRQGLKPITTERRDLFRRPLMRDELKHFQGIVFDPPRAGAEAQSKQLARSVVKKVAAVSCNPTTLARDLSILSGGGFKIKKVVAIDQFLWSPHVEVVALLER